ncbi:MAG: hypothetical protein DMF54_08630 [Acidobacteria bacterium]|nr:MAG: hypothetical protein DMF54_08630 [Acidobacteriota bacterium]
MNFVRNFLSIVGAALGSSVLGGIFGSVVAVISPEFVKSLTAPPEAGSLVRYAGTAVMGFSLLIAAIVRLTKALDANRSRDRVA